MTNASLDGQPLVAQVDVHAFGYLQTRVAYTQGSLNDVARVVAIVNQRFAH
jgi:hypothetical protein